MNQIAPVPTPAALPPEPEQLYKKRVKVFPKAVSGSFRRLKWVILIVTLGIYYLTPWLRWDRGPYAPDQAVLVDLAGRRFFFGPIEIWPQEFYYVAGMLIMAGFGLFLVTTTVGRAWCGYACPQTVWTDLFMAVERWIQGDRNARMKLDKAPWGAEKALKLGSTHAIWLGIALMTGGAWVFYFADAPTLLGQLLNGTAPFAAYASIAVLTFTTYSLAGLMREQVCTYMCPWPRIQSAMLDEDSFIVTYKGWRGEPRASVKDAKAAEAVGEKAGDCIDCMACVNVCPTGIDIRNGPQLECITCALCIDACNDMMEKVGRPLDLIGYSTLNRDAAEQRGETLPPMWKTILRPRVILYSLVWASIGLFMLWVLAGRESLDLTVAQARNPVFVQMSDGGVRNSYTVKILNKEHRPRDFNLSVDGMPGAELSNPLLMLPPAETVRVTVRPDGVETLTLQVRVPGDQLKAEHADISIVARPVDGAGEARVETRFTGPVR